MVLPWQLEREPNWNPGNPLNKIIVHFLLTCLFSLTIHPNFWFMLLFHSEREISLYGSCQGRGSRKEPDFPWRAWHYWVVLACGEHECHPQFWGKGFGRVLSSLNGFQKAGRHYPVSPCFTDLCGFLLSTKLCLVFQMC